MGLFLIHKHLFWALCKKLFLKIKCPEQCLTTYQAINYVLNEIERCRPSVRIKSLHFKQTNMDNMKMIPNRPIHPTSIIYSLGEVALLNHVTGLVTSLELNFQV